MPEGRHGGAIWVLWMLLGKVTKRSEIGALREGMIGFALDPHDGRYNAALVVIRFSAGKCVAAEFLAD